MGLEQSDKGKLIVEASEEMGIRRTGFVGHYEDFGFDLK